jgi:acyl-CoA thioester hydrolase
MSARTSKGDKRLARRESYTFWVREHVRFSDTDLVGHANNLAFGAFAETGRCLLLKRFMGGESADRAMFFPAQIVLNFLGEIFWPAQIDVGTAIIGVGTSSFRFGQGMFDGERCFATSESVFVLVDETSHRPIAIPASIRDWLGGYALAE